MTTQKMTAGAKVEINGKTYTVKRAPTLQTKCIDLVGPRGGSAALIQNVNSGRWVLLTMNGHRGVEVRVESFAVVG